MTTTIAMDAVDSSQIHCIGHDAASSTLALRFMNKDGAPTSLYHYRNVSTDDFTAFRAAGSIGYRKDPARAIKVRERFAKVVRAAM